MAAAGKPPTGFFRDFVVSHDGERSGTLDIKRGGLLPVVDIARWAGVSAGVTSASTPERLRAGREAGVLHEERRGRLIYLGRAAGQRDDPGIECLDIRLQCLRRVVRRIQGNKQNLHRSPCGSQFLQGVGQLQQGGRAQIRAGQKTEVDHNDRA